MRRSHAVDSPVISVSASLRLLEYSAPVRASSQREHHHTPETRRAPHIHHTFSNLLDLNVFTGTNKLVKCYKLIYPSEIIALTCKGGRSWIELRAHGACEFI